MTWVLYSLIKGRNGRQPSAFSVASITVDSDWNIVIDCPNRELFRKLRQYFATPIKVRYHIAKPPQFYSYGWKEIEPGSEEYFREALDRLHHIDLLAISVNA